MGHIHPPIAVTPTAAPARGCSQRNFRGTGPDHTGVVGIEPSLGPVSVRELAGSQPLMLRLNTAQRELLERLEKRHGIPGALDDAGSERATLRGVSVLAPPTDRELEVLQLVADGYCNRDVGARLHLSEDTIKSHLRNLFEKFDARNRTHAAVIALRRGLIR
jgi:DNA-binding NarL/FixJ family response regulator